MTRTKLAFVGFVAAGNSMWHQVLDDLCLVVTDQSATTCDSSYAPNSTQYNSVLQSSEKCYSVLQSTTPESTTPVLLRTTKNYLVLQSTSPVLLRTTKYYKVLVQYYSVLQSTTPVLLCTTNVLQSTSPVLLQYYFVLQSTTPVLVQYYRVLLQYYFVLQRTTPVLQSTSPVLLRTTKYYSSTTSYYKGLLQYYFVLQSNSSTTKY